MDTKKPRIERPDEDPEVREKLLSALTPENRTLVEGVMTLHGMTAGEAIEHLMKGN
jgi:hypothetical protein